MPKFFFFWLKFNHVVMKETNQVTTEGANVGMVCVCVMGGGGMKETHLYGRGKLRYKIC